MDSSIQEGHSKIVNLNYTNLEMQDYFKDNKITKSQARTIFKFRTRMEKFSENFKGGKPIKECPLCGENEDSQIHSFVCPKIKENIEVEGKLEDIFSPVIRKEIAKTLENIVKFRAEYMEA